MNTASSGAGGASFTVDYSRAGNSVDNQAHAQSFMTNIDDAIDNVSDALTYWFFNQYINLSAGIAIDFSIEHTSCPIHESWMQTWRMSSRIQQSC